FMHWTETSLLRAYLIGNDKTKIIFSLSQLHYDCKDTLKKVFPEYNPQNDKDGLRDEKYEPFEIPKEHYASSIYLRM
ncbi:MAG: hypothetical protein ACK4GN_05070, partial [Runella sp.]